MNPTTNNKIIKAVEHAQRKHPDFASNFEHAVSLATEELGELAKAINEGDLKAAQAETLDTIAVQVRIHDWLEEYL